MGGCALMVGGCTTALVAPAIQGAHDAARRQVEQSRAEAAAEATAADADVIEQSERPREYFPDMFDAEDNAEDGPIAPDVEPAGREYRVWTAGTHTVRAAFVDFDVADRRLRFCGKTTARKSRCRSIG